MLLCDNALTNNSLVIEKLYIFLTNGDLSNIPKSIQIDVGISLHLILQVLMSHISHMKMMIEVLKRVVRLRFQLDNTFMWSYRVNHVTSKIHRVINGFRERELIHAIKIDFK